MTTPQEDCFNLAGIHCKEEFNYLDLDSLKSDQNPANWTYGTKQEMINWHAVSQEDQWNFCSSPDEKTYHTLQPSGWIATSEHPNMDVENPYENYDPLFKCAEALMRNPESQTPQYDISFGQTGEYHRDLSVASNVKDVTYNNDPHRRLPSSSATSNYSSQNDKIHGNFQVNTEQDRYENLRIKPEPKIVKIIKGSRINGDDEVVILGEYKGSSVPAYRGHLKTNSNGEQYLELTRGSSPKKVTLLKTPGKVLKLGPLSPVRGVTKKCSIIMKNIYNDNKCEIGKPKHIILTSPPQLPSITDKQVLRVSPIKYIRVAPLQTLTGRPCENEGHSRSYVPHSPKEVWVKSHDQDKQPFPTMTPGIHKIKDFKKDSINVPITYKILANGLISANCNPSPHIPDKSKFLLSGSMDISNELAVNIQRCGDSKPRNSDDVSKHLDTEDTWTMSDERKKDSSQQSPAIQDSIQPTSPTVPRVPEVKKLMTIMKTEDESMLVNPPVLQELSVSSEVELKSCNAPRKRLLFRCHNCGQRQATRNSLITHIKSHRLPFCKLCLIVCNSEEQLQSHMVKGHPNTAAQLFHHNLHYVTSKYGRRRAVIETSSLVPRRKQIKPNEEPEKYSKRRHVFKFRKHLVSKRL